MNHIAASQFMKIQDLERELQLQKGILWVLGEIIKLSINITLFEELMQITTDMLIGVAGVDTCYIWTYEGEELKGYLRTTKLRNEFITVDNPKMNGEIRLVQAPQVFLAKDIHTPVYEGISTPKSRLVVALMNYHDNTMIGQLILEQDQEDFFTSNMISFFETLAIYISCNTKNSRMFETVREDSETDMLTKAYNRRYLHKIFDKLVASYKEMTVAIIDTDNFKEINDTHGHLIGDQVIKNIATEAMRIVRAKGGEVVRYGGDEFVLLIPLSLREAMSSLLNLQASVPNLRCVTGQQISTTITIGVAEYPLAATDPYELVGLADAALLEGKKDGKNCMKIAKATGF